MADPLTSLRKMQDFLRDAPVSRESFAEICRRTRLVLDGSLVFFVEFVPEGIVALDLHSIRGGLASSWDRQGLFSWLVSAVVTRQDSEGRVVSGTELPESLKRFLGLDGIGVWMAVSVPCSLERQGVLFVGRAADSALAWNQDETTLLRVMGDLVAMWWSRDRLRTKLMEERCKGEQNHRARSDFVALLSHELRTPLSPLVGFTQILEQSSENLSDDSRDMIRRIYDGALRLQELVEDLLTLTRLDGRLNPGERYSCEISAVLADVVSYARRQAVTRGIQIRAEVPDASGIIEADGAALRRSLRALVSNAVRHSPEHGTVTISAECRDHELIVRVGDEGPGVPDPRKERIFDAFVQGEPVLTRKHGGAGVGLTLVRLLAESHYGRTWVTDHPSGGAVFHLVLPRKAASGVVSRDPPRG
jgi:signal transduction histidine kinase